MAGCFGFRPHPQLYERGRDKRGEAEWPATDDQSAEDGCPRFEVPDLDPFAAQLLFAGTGVREECGRGSGSGTGSGLAGQGRDTDRGPAR